MSVAPDRSAQAVGAAATRPDSPRAPRGLPERSADGGAEPESARRFGLRRVWLVILLVMLLSRAGLNVTWFIDAWTRPDDCHFLESAIARLIDVAARPEERLYPDPEGFPHLHNVFAPGYFELVGRWRRALTGDETLTIFLGRTVTLLSNLTLTLTLLAVVGWRLGFGAGLFAAATWLASMSLIGFGVMVRPDVLATTLGLIGLLLANSRRTPLSAIGVLTIVAAALVKQTSLLFLGAAALADWRSGRRIRALVVLTTGLVGLVALVLGLDRSTHPGLAAAFLFESGTPFLGGQFFTILGRSLMQTPELFLLTAWIWWAPRLGSPPRLADAGSESAPELAAEAAWEAAELERVREFTGLARAGVTVAGLAALATIGKIGSDMNYLLPLAATAPLVAGLLAASLGRDPLPRRAVPPAGWVILIALAVALLAPALDHWRRVRIHRLTLPSEEPFKERHLQLTNLLTRMRDVRGFVLTDDVRLAMSLGSRSAVRDPWLYRQLVEDGRQSPEPVLSRIREGVFEYIILGRPPGVDHPFALPTRVSRLIPERYQFGFATAGLQVWVRKGTKLVE